MLNFFFSVCRRNNSLVEVVDHWSQAFNNFICIKVTHQTSNHRFQSLIVLEICTQFMRVLCKNLWKYQKLCWCIESELKSSWIICNISTVKREKKITRKYAVKWGEGWWVWVEKYFLHLAQLSRCTQLNSTPKRYENKINFTFYTALCTDIIRRRLWFFYFARQKTSFLRHHQRQLSECEHARESNISFKRLKFKL